MRMMSWWSLPFLGMIALLGIMSAVSPPRPDAVVEDYPDKVGNMAWKGRAGRERKRERGGV